jgi:hypothetical protein
LTLLRWAFAAALAAGTALAHAESLRFCDRPAPADARQQDRLLRFAAIVKTELDRGSASAALVSRSGLDLARFGLRYSHAGVGLRQGDTPWSVRQLYYACDERRPRLYDQGMAGFVMGMSDAAIGYVSIVSLPEAPAERLARRAADTPAVLRLLGARYSANAYAFAETFQNCNQWVMELLATAWGAPADGDDPRGAAQHWLRDAGYAPHAFRLGPWWMWASVFVPWVHHADHPTEDVAAGVYRVSMPVSIEAFVRKQVPGAERVELCHAAGRVVIHRGWTPIAEGCVPAQADTVVALD